MAYTYGVMPAFSGVRMDVSEALMSADLSPDACNMDTRSGDLKSATGFSWATRGTLPSGEKLLRLIIYPNEHGMRFLAVTETGLYSYRSVQYGWRQIYPFEYEPDPERIDYAPVMLGSNDRLLIAIGIGQALLYNERTDEAELFGSAEKGSDLPIAYAALHFGRLFAAGNMLKPSRLYWSKTPGGDRTIDDWRSDPASENVSGGFVDVGIGNDPITGLFPLSNQLIIFTRNSMYRLLGDRPSNFRVLAVDAAVGMPAHMACLRYADRLYFMTDSGLCCYDGQTVRRPQNAAAMAPLLKASYLECMASAACDDKLYFAFRTSASETYCDRMIEYDLLRDRCMLRSGFHLVDLATASGKLYALTDAGRPVCFDESDSYDGDPIDAWWVTPCMDLGHKEAVKTLLSLTATGSGTVGVRVESNGAVYNTQATFDETACSVTEIPLRGVGRVFRMRFSNVNGAPMRLDAKAALLFDLEKRPV